MCGEKEGWGGEKGEGKGGGLAGTSASANGCSCVGVARQGWARLSGLSACALE